MLGGPLLSQTADLKAICSLLPPDRLLSFFPTYFFEMWQSTFPLSKFLLLQKINKSKIIRHEGGGGWFKHAGMQNGLALFTVSWWKTQFGSMSWGISSVEGKESEHSVITKWIGFYLFFYIKEVEPLMFVFYFGMTLKWLRSVIAFYFFIFSKCARALREREVYILCVCARTELG